MLSQCSKFSLHGLKNVCNISSIEIDFQFKKIFISKWILLDYLWPGANIDFLKMLKKVLDFVCKLLCSSSWKSVGPYYVENQRLPWLIASLITAAWELCK